MTAPPFVHLHVHSDYSAMRGVSSLEELCTSAHQQGLRTLALTDTNGLYGAIRFIEQAKQQGLQPILGAELTTNDHRAVLLAKTTDGYANLCRLLSERHCDPAFDCVAAVHRYRNGLIILTDDQTALAAWVKDSEQDLYVELTPGPAMHVRCYSAVAPACRLLPPTGCILCDPKALQPIGCSVPSPSIPHSRDCRHRPAVRPHNGSCHLHEMASEFPHVPEALENTVRIASACHSDWRFGDTIFPAFRQFTDEDAFAVLQEKTYAGARERYGELSPEVRERIKKELIVIREKRFAHYFLVVDEIVQEAPRTCGRGSVAASIVSYCLKITHVDPIKHRFVLRAVFKSRPERPARHRHRFSLGRTRSYSRVGVSHNTVNAKPRWWRIRTAWGSVRPSAKRRRSMACPPMKSARRHRESARQNDLLRFAEPPTEEHWLERARADHCDLKAPWPEILAQALRAQNHFRHLSMHCGGVVIVPDEIRRYVPVEFTAKGLPVIQWEKDQTEEAGLVKIDILGNRSLAVIRDALAAVARHTGRRSTMRAGIRSTTTPPRN